MLDYLIVGQGLAGSLLAWELLQRGQRVVVFDEPGANRASQVAAGLYNPVTGRQRKVTWLADELFPYLEKFYPALERYLGANFFHPMPLFRPWPVSSPTPTYTRAQQAYATLCPARFHFSLGQVVGGLQVHHAGYVDLPQLLRAMRQYLQSCQAYVVQAFQHDQLQLTNNAVRYHTWAARRLVFCEGPQVVQNPYFNALALRPVKGELLEIDLASPLLQIYNETVFMLPTIGARTLVGATYERHFGHSLPTVEGYHTLTTHLKALLPTPYQVRAHRAGIRPAMFDHRPCLGAHPKHPQLFVFNGLGTKGVSLAPYFADCMTHYLVHGKPLPLSVRPRWGK